MLNLFKYVTPQILPRNPTLLLHQPIRQHRHQIPRPRKKEQLCPKRTILF